MPAPTLEQFLAFLKARRATQAMADVQVPDDISAALGRFLLLCDVPFNYLVADEGMLPAESIKFFHLDHDWLLSLLDGALSVGTLTTADHTLDRELRQTVYDAAVQASKALRDGSSTGSNTIVSGFLLRSAVVQGWPGLEVSGYDANTAELRLLRLERLAPNMLLGLFDGALQSFNIHLPPEGLHFGVDDADVDEDQPELMGKTVKYLRYLDGDTPGKEIPRPKKPGDKKERYEAVAVPFRAGNARVVRIKALADQLHEGLPGKPQITSAEFAVQMTQGADVVPFELQVTAP